MILECEKKEQDNDRELKISALNTSFIGKVIMKKILAKKRKELIKRIHSLYMDTKDALRREPEKLTKISNSTILTALVIYILEIVECAKPSKVILGILCIAIMVYIVLILYWGHIEKSFAEFRHQKEDDIKDLLSMATADEAEKLGINKDELVIYLLLTNRSSLWIKIINRAISIIATSYAVYKIPGYIQFEHDIIIFGILVVANLFVSYSVDFITKKIDEHYIFDFCIKKPYRILIQEVDEKFMKYNL